MIFFCFFFKTATLTSFAAASVKLRMALHSSRLYKDKIREKNTYEYFDVVTISSAKLEISQRFVFRKGGFMEF